MKNSFLLDLIYEHDFVSEASKYYTMSGQSPVLGSLPMVWMVQTLDVEPLDRRCNIVEGSTQLVLRLFDTEKCGGPTSRESGEAQNQCGHQVRTSRCLNFSVAQFCLKRAVFLKSKIHTYGASASINYGMPKLSFDDSVMGSRYTCVEPDFRHHFETGFEGCTDCLDSLRLPI